MKFIFLLALTLFSTLASAQRFPRHDPPYPHCHNPYSPCGGHRPRTTIFCPSPSQQWLPVKHILDSADSRSTQATCTVEVAGKASQGGASYEPITTTSSTCDTDDIISAGGKDWIFGMVSYKLEVTQCQSNPGCKEECVPTVNFPLL